MRAKGQSLGSLTYWLMNAAISFAIPTLAAWSKSIPFMFFSAMMVLQFVAVLLAFPETKGMSLEEKCGAAWRRLRLDGPTAYRCVRNTNQVG